MLKVWRSTNKVFAECTACGSYGTAGHLQLRMEMTPEIEAAVEKHTAHMMALRSHYTTAATKLSQQVKDGSMSRADATQKIRSLWENHVAQVRLSAAGLPSPEGQVTEIAEKCPWCDAPQQVEVEFLSDDKTEPDFALAIPVREHIAKNLDRGA